MRISWKLGLAAVVAATVVVGRAPSAEAASITCLPDSERVATLASAVSCSTGDEVNINSSSSLNAVLGTSYGWVQEGAIVPGDGASGTHANDLLTITLLTGSWGGNSGISGTWAIDPSFWSGLNYTIGAITMHVGQGQGNPDAFAWIITPGATSGTFSYSDLDGKGGGFSNMFLFGTEPRTTTTTTTSTTTTSGTPTSGTIPSTVSGVPEPNAGLLSAFGMLSVVALRLIGRRANAQKGR